MSSQQSPASKFIFATKALLGTDMFQFLVLASKPSEICNALKDAGYHDPRVHRKSTRAVTPWGIEFKDDLKDNRILGQKNVGRFLPTITEKKEFWIYYFCEHRTLLWGETKSDAAHTFSRVFPKKLNLLESQVWRNGNIFHSKLRVIDRIEYQIVSCGKCVFLFGAFLIKRLQFPFQFGTIVAPQLCEKFHINNFGFRVFHREKIKQIENWKDKTKEELIPKFIKKSELGRILKSEPFITLNESDYKTQNE